MADLERMGLRLFTPPATLQDREVQRLTDFLMAKVIGQGEMNRDECIEFWDEDADACQDEFPR